MKGKLYNFTFKLNTFFEVKNFFERFILRMALNLKRFL